ncbi:hypothetical protein PRIPAC_78464 [Pristionchus pacificus]|uniref:Uncharacterized protein n=1 Tax=Pristionchus pacificus TaxID=54126 RepID=A0A2A6CMR9_PRIPA|nr:hypothetical protein PRIPAC_78464 [Pristionchus pacificus]|eukprot:PDM79321.1 hypothetical protein PRIPAC_31900 [Pristionchus pacificus]
MSDFSRLVLMEGLPKTKDVAMNISFYAVFEPTVLALISVFFILIWLLQCTTNTKLGAAYQYGTVVNLLNFVGRFIHLSMLFIFYQCLFNGNAVVERTPPSSDFRIVADDLQRGSRRMLVDIGLLMENEDRTCLLSRLLVPARGNGTAFAAYQATFSTGNAVETISKEWAPISLLHTMYPMIGFSVGIMGAIIAFATELLVYFIRRRWHHSR